MWFVFAVLTALLWGGADLFYKKGSDPEDKYSHLKIVIMVGLVMGVHGLAYLLITGCDFRPFDMLFYLPVSICYIGSMTVGYVGLRYLELSIASPVQNSSGAVTTVLCLIFFTYSLSIVEGVGIVFILAGIIVLALLEKKNAEDEHLKAGENIDPKYRIGVLAITFPILYCIIDGLGTFADAVYLDELELISESSALLAYEFTFFICAVLVWLWLKIFKKQTVNPFKEGTRGGAAILETAGQFFYVFAMSGKAILAAPIIASYSIFSVILSRIFLKEKLSVQKYIVVAVIMVGIALLGVAEGLA